MDMNCELCSESVPLSGIFEHFRLLHPEIKQKPEGWPEGLLYVIDETSNEEHIL